jgi:hypothetical protein
MFAFIFDAVVQSLNNAPAVVATIAVITVAVWLLLLLL